MTTPTSAEGPLAGLRVIELADCIGQWAGKLMADLGAEVIKVEPPEGVPERQVGPFYQDQPDPNRSLYFWHYNTSKRGVTLNLEQEQGRESADRAHRSAPIARRNSPTYCSIASAGSV